MKELSYGDMLLLKDLIGDKEFDDLQMLLMDEYPFHSKCFGELIPDKQVYPNPIISVFQCTLGLDPDYTEGDNLIFYEYDVDEEVSKDFTQVIMEHVELTSSPMGQRALFMSIDPLVYDLLPYVIESKGKRYYKHKDKTGAVNYISYSNNEVLFYQDHFPSLKDIDRQGTVYADNDNFTEEEEFRSTLDTQFNEYDLLRVFMTIETYQTTLKKHISSYIKEKMC